MEFRHIPVMPDECINGLDIKPDGLYIDGTVGGAGHSYEIASRLTSGKLIAFDRDEEAIEAAKERLSGFDDKVELIKSNFSEIPTLLKGMHPDGLLLDLGISSHQIDDPERGFSYMQDGPLDMRMDRTASLSAAVVVNTYDRNDLARIIRDYGEERFAGRIASAIAARREKKPFDSTADLGEVVRRAVPKGKESHPEKRTFQAIRIEVNGELDIIAGTINGVFDMMNGGGRIAVITFHSLEDRIVKNTFAELCRGCICPPDFPVCVCGRTPRGKLVSKKPILPAEEEMRVNPRSKSAKLRIIEKL
ncbi:MAG: 16S rRNA (cytosine(1402)-N(4))-methyltransferase RsmH [Clostridia bacterium]|nr:16S rRNA (cytosine(1402)-N(4))-methyltransferase RsmH [Clostridia bacterium]